MDRLTVLKKYIKDNSLKVNDFVNILNFNKSFYNDYEALQFLKNQDLFKKDFKPFYNEYDQQCITINDLEFDIQGIYMAYMKKRDSYNTIVNKMFKDYNIKSKEDEWFMKQEKIFSSNIRYINKNIKSFNSKYPHLTKIMGKSWGYYKELNALGIDKITNDKNSINDYSTFEVSNRYFTEYLKKNFSGSKHNRNTVDKTLKMMSLLGLIKLIKVNDIPDEQLEKFKDTDKDNITNHYYIPKLTADKLLDIEEIAKKCRKNGLTISKISRDAVLDSFGPYVFNDLYGDTEFNTKKALSRKRKIEEEKEEEKKEQQIKDSNIDDIMNLIGF